MTTTTKAILVKIASALISAGVPKDSAERIATSVFIDEAMKDGKTMSEAYDMVFGAGGWEKLKASI